MDARIFRRVAAAGVLCFSLLGLGETIGRGEEADGTLAAAKKSQAALLQGLQAKGAEAQRALQAWYLGALEAARKEAIAKGDLDGVVAADNERDRAGRELNDGEKKALPPAIRALREQWDSARERQEAMEKAAMTNAMRLHLALLGEMEKLLTHQGQIDAAKQVRQEREAVAEQLQPSQGAKASNTAANAGPAVLKDLTNTRWKWVTTIDETYFPSWLELRDKGEASSSWNPKMTWRMEGDVLVVIGELHTWRFQMEPGRKTGKTIVKSRQDEDRTIRFDKMLN